MPAKGFMSRPAEYAALNWLQLFWLRLLKRGHCRQIS
jgi:hypothetical protein